MYLFKPAFEKKFFIQVIVLSILALIVHAIVLKFIFPGYYSPLYPHHSDFYISVALANSPDDFFQYRYLGYSRPLGLFFLKIIGYLGLHGAILFTVINVILNCSLTILFFKTLTGIKFDWLFVLLFCLYCFTLFSQAYFYTFYTQDVFSHLSYFLLLTGFLLFYNFHITHKRYSYFFLLFFGLCAFLCKETYALSALFFALMWWWYYRRTYYKTAVVPFIIIGAALLATLAFNISIKSIFTDFRKTSLTDPYYVNFSAKSIVKELSEYAREGLNPINWLMIAASLLFNFFNGNKKRSLLLAGCVVAAFLSWLPNALIPNHHHGGYSFNGAYFLYIPLLSILLVSGRKWFFILAGVIMIAFSLISPMFNTKEYAKQWWILEQENNQRNLLHSLNPLMEQVTPSKKGQAILITGLTMPFYPFHHPLSLKDYSNFQYATYDVVNYSMGSGTARDNLVKFIPPSEVKIEKYNAIWMFGANGVILRSLDINPTTSEAIIKNNFLDLVIYPDSLKIQKLSSIL